MRLIRIEDEDRDWFGVSLAAAAGLGLGIVAGIAVHDLFGSLRERVGRRLRRTDGTTPADDPDALRQAVLHALTQHPATRSLELDVRALGEGIIELTGTAPDADLRDLAGSTARAVAGTSVVVNRMLISDHGGSLRRRTPSAAS
ncbi:MAG: BON domain-containing protein [Gemmatimonadota bacterium]|nr:BON domain-containing protein [Gemmatimonadota bacterium]